MIKEGPHHNISTVADCAAQKPYIEFLKQERHYYSQALSIDLLYELFPFCTQETLTQLKNALPRFKWVYENKAATYRALIGRYFPFLQRTHSTEVQEKPQELFQETLKKLYRVARGNHISCNNTPSGEILDALDGNEKNMRAKHSSIERFFPAKVINSWLVFCGIKKKDCEESRHRLALTLLLAYKQYLTTHKFNKAAFSLEQALTFKKMAIFFGNLALLQEIVKAYALYTLNSFSFLGDLYDATLYGHTDIVSWILDGPFAELDKKYQRREYALRFSGTSHPEALKIIFTKCVLPQQKFDYVLLANARIKSGYSIIEYMFSLSKETCMFSCDTYLQALQSAFNHNHMNIVDFLLSRDEYVAMLVSHPLDPKLAEYIGQKKQEKNKPLFKTSAQESQRRKLEQNREKQTDPLLTFFPNAVKNCDPPNRNLSTV